LIVAGAALLGAAWAGDWGGIQEKTQAAIDFLSPIFEAIKAWLEVNLPIAMEALRTFWVDTAWPAIQSVVETVWPVIEKIFSAIVTFITGTLIPTASNLYTQWTTVWWPTIQTVTENVWKVISAIFTELGRWINDNIIPWVSYFHTQWTTVWWPAIQKAITDMWAVVEPVYQAIKTWMDTTLPPVLTGLQTAFKNVMSGIDSAVTPVKTLWGEFVDAIKGFWNWISSHVFNFTIHIPDLPKWAIPGSPLPIHTAWKAFAEDMQAMAGAVMPVNTSLVVAAATGAVTGGLPGNTINNYYNLNANYGYQSPTSLASDVRMLAMLNGRA
jgi:phage-related protein